MTTHPASSERLSEVARLATLLADRVLDAQIMSRPILDAQIQALLDAALLLEEHEMPLPPLLKQILHEVERTSDEEDTDEPHQREQRSPPESDPDSSTQRLGEGFSRLLRSLRKRPS